MPGFCLLLLLAAGASLTPAVEPNVPRLPWQERSDWINVNTQYLAFRAERAGLSDLSSRRDGHEVHR